MDSIEQPYPEKVWWQRLNVLLIGGSLLTLFIILLVSWYTVSVATPRSNGPIRVEVTPGMSVREITAAVAEADVVISDLALYAVLTYFYDPTKIFAGTYVFSGHETIWDVAAKLGSNDLDDDLLRVTFPEGITTEMMAEIASKILPHFQADVYEALTADYEGYMFPETYFVPQTFTAEDMFTLQKNTFADRLAELRLNEAPTALKEEEIIILASIIEREANDETSMRLVSGILQNRLEINMALQADASIEYILHKPLSELTPADLDIDSPYNTYTNVGLPPTPIGNPGLTAIEAVVHPTQSDYFYYITDADGIFHYAKTYAEHQRNIELYL